MSRWHFPELIKSKWTDWRERVSDDKMWRELHNNQCEIARLKRENAELRATNRKLLKRIQNTHRV